MPSQVVFDIFSLPGVTPSYAHSISAGNRILANNAKTIGVTMKVGKVVTLGKKHPGVGASKDVTGGDIRTEGWRDSRDWRYSQQQKDILGGLPANRQVPQPAGVAAHAANAAISTSIPVIGGMLGGMAQAMLTPTSGAMPVVWSQGMTQGGRLGEAVNPSVWDQTYSGRSGIFMHNGAAAYDAVLLHETLHMCGLHHVATADNVMHATMTSTSAQSKLTATQKQALKDASF